MPTAESRERAGSPSGKGPFSKGKRLKNSGGGADEETPLLEEVSSFLALWEPLTDSYRAQNPSPLRLFVQHFGVTIIQIASIFGGYAFLVSNALVVFPRCSRYPILDHVLGLQTGTGYLCEFASIMLWTFPLMCCMLIPIFQYWDFCDSRVYYECLRERIFLRPSMKPFFGSPILIFIVAWLLIGLSMIFFSWPGGWEEGKNMLRGLFPFLLPVFSFMITIYVAWDISFFLVPLAKFIECDVEWCKGHISNCVEAWDEQVRMAAERVLAAGKFSQGGSSSQVFEAVRKELDDADIRLSARVNSDGVDQESVIEESSQAWKKLCALCFGMKGYWMTDLLWLPTDERSREFKVAFRCLAAATMVVEMNVILLFTCTVYQYMTIQGHIDEQLFGWMPDLRAFIIVSP